MNGSPAAAQVIDQLADQERDVVDLGRKGERARLRRAVFAVGTVGARQP